MKIYGFWVLLFSTATKVNSTPPNLYLLKDGSYTHCLIANETESSAVILTTPNRIPVTSHHYPNDASFCKISTDPVCGRKLNNDVWKYDVSENYDLNPIDDQRWEDLNFINTTPHKVRKFVNVYNVLEQGADFNITLSIKIKQEAQIFLCDQMTPLNSNCYWFIIGGWNGTKGVVRKCNKSSLPEEEDKFPNQNTACGSPPNKNYTTPHLNLNTWSNFVFRKINNTYSITKGTGKILDYTDTNAECFKTKYVFVSSIQKYPGEWKINGDPKVYKTGVPYVYIELFSNNIRQFTFSVSANEKSNLYVGLCENDNHSSCYKIIIDHGKVARACTFNLTKPDKCMQDITATKNQTVNFAPVNHLTLKFKNGKYTLLNNSHPLLQFHDTSIKPKQVLIGSNIATTWKIQSYGLLTANTTGNTAINLNKGKKGQNICVAIFAQSCQTCNLTIKLQDEQNRSLDTKTPSTKNTWEEIKLSTILENDTVLKLRIMLSTTNNGRAFIGDIRNCTQSARIISTPWGTEPISCNSLKFPKVKPVEHETTVIIPTYNNDSIDIFWLSEYKGATKLQTKLRYKGCGISEELNISEHEKNIVVGSLSKTNLRRIPYSSYDISFIDGNNNLFSKNVDFEATDDFSHEEKNPTISVTQAEDKLIVNVSVNDCKKIQGPLYYSIKANCIDESCIGESWENSSIAHPSAEIELLNIVSQSKYKISIAFSRTSNFTNLDYKEISLLNNTDLTEEENYTDTLIGTLVTLFLLCLCTGAIFYMYKKDIITCKPVCLHLVLRTSETPKISEPDDVEMATLFHSIEIDELDKYIRKAEQKMLLQYNAIEDLPVKPHTVGLLTENVRKNRYKNIIAYDDTRVVLNSLYSNVDGDYINANYINGFGEEKVYIAAQGPKFPTLYDFWRMIWQENIECIVMLSKLVENGKEKCEQYWPEEKHEYKEFQVECIDTKSMENHLTIRTLALSCGSMQRQVTQIHYEGWLDKDVPTSTQGLREVLRLMQDFQKPYLIHCSAGVGRTGTLILSDIAIKMAKATQTVDMYSILHDMRQQRMKLVQIFSQYVFAHQVVKDAIMDLR